MAPAIAPLPPRGPTVAPNKSLGIAWGAEQTPGAVSAKEQCFRIAACVELPMQRRRTRWSYSIERVFTTLDNGYLGSRIDEERSEVRYLV